MSGKTKQVKKDVSKKSPSPKKASESPLKKETKNPSKLQNKRESDTSAKPTAQPESQDDAPAAKMDGQSTEKSRFFATTANSVVPVTATGTASQRLLTGKKDDITEAIDSLKVVKNQIAVTSKDASNED